MLAISARRCAQPRLARPLSTRVRSILSHFDISHDKPNFGVYDGAWKGSGPLLHSHNPSTGELLAQVHSATRDEAHAVLDHARQAYTDWRMVPAPKRGDIARQIRVELADNLDMLGQLVSVEMGKILQEGRGEVQEGVDIMDYACGLSRMLKGSVLPSERPNHFLMEVPNPLGVCGVISAQNFPVAVYLWNLSLSLVAGNATVWKPAPTTPLCGLATTKLVARVLERNGINGATAALISGATEVGETLAKDHRVDLLSFTGSEKVGQKVGVMVQERFGKNLLELGGNGAVIVMDDANLDLAIPTVLFGAVGTAGQRCTSTRRLLLHSSIKDEFLRRLTKAYNQIKIGDPLENGTLCGPIHSPQGLKLFKQALEHTQAQGGKLIHGETSYTPADTSLQGGNWAQPVIALHDIKNGQVPDIMKEETFGPLLHVAAFQTLDEAIEINNNVRQGLGSSLFTQDMSNVYRWTSANGSDCGLVNVNQSTSGAEIGCPFGGNKWTGWGRESGGDAWKQFCRWSSCTINYGKEMGLAQGIKFE